MSPKSKSDRDNKPEIDWSDARPKLVRLAVMLVGFGVVPVVVNALTPAVLPMKARYWTVPRWWVRTVTACTLLVAAVVAWELAHVFGGWPRASDPTTARRSGSGTTCPSGSSTSSSAPC